jgi:hypothetical protein
VKDDALYYFKPLRVMLKNGIEEAHKISSTYELYSDKKQSLASDFRRCLLHCILRQFVADAEDKCYFYLYTKNTILSIPHPWPNHHPKIIKNLHTIISKINSLIDGRIILTDVDSLIKAKMWGRDVPSELREAIILQHYSGSHYHDLPRRIQKFCRKNGLFEIKDTFKVHNLV